MSENEKNVPRRRFREFQNAKGWEQRKLGNIVDIRSGRDYKHLSEGEIPVYGTGGYMLSVNEALSYKEDAIGIGRKGTIDKPYILRAPFWTVDTLFYAVPETNTDLDFIYGIFQNINWKQKDESTGVPSLSKTAINDIDVLIPEYKEQKQIGNFFQNIDKHITLHQRKLEKMKALKKAYLTEMFPAEGERKPKRRFDAFGDDWEQRKVKDICSISTGKSNTQDKIEDGEYPFYVRSPIIERSNRYLYDEEAVLTVGDGVGTGKVFHYVNGKYDLHQRVYRMFDFCNGVSVKYFYYYFSKYFYDRVMAMTAKTSVDSVRYEMIAEMDIKYPSEQEQNQIVITLEQLDNLITIHQYKLEKLQNIKKAYLNEMFI